MDPFKITPEEKLDNYNNYGGGFSTYEGLPTLGNTPQIQPIVQTSFVNDYLTKQQEDQLKKSTIVKPVKPLKSEQLTVSEELEYSDKDMADILSSYNKKNFNWDVKPTKAKSTKNLDYTTFESEIRRKESDGIATADNPNSSAVGYYQFLWGSWGKDIARVTGIKSSEEFKKRPDMQKKFFKFYYENYITPAVNRIKSKLGGKVELGDFDIAQLIHFRGEGGARKVLSNGELHKKHEGYNPTPLQYINN